MNKSIVKYFFYPVHEFLRGRKTLKYFTELEKTQWYSPEQVKELQWKKLKALLKHAYKNVPYYQKCWNKIGLKPKDIKDYSDFQKMPFLTKDDIKKNLTELIARGYEKKLLRNSTGGSTGEPLFFYTDRVKETYHNAAKLMARRWWGIDIGDREIDLWGSPIDLSQRDWIRTFKDRFLNLIVLSAFDLSEKSMHRYIEIIRRFNPKFIYGYATALYRFAQFLNENNIDVKSLKLQAIISTAEMLYEHQRELIQTTFDCPVVNEYGSHDGGLIAYECPNKRMHIMSDQVYVEYINNNKPVSTGESGEIVITNLVGFGMPFIRYKIGDMGIGKEEVCSCGRGSPIMEDIKGRVADMLVSPSGKAVHAWSVNYILRELQLTGMKQFKVTQKTTSKIIVEIIRDSDFDANNVRLIKEKIYKLMEKNIEVEIKFVNEILPGKSGKYRWVVSEVAGVRS